MPGLIFCQSLASTPFVFLLLDRRRCARMNPALEEASGTSGASPADHVPPRHAAGAAARPARAADPDHADHRRAVRAAADDRPAGAHHRVQLSHLFRAQPGRRPAELRRRRRDVAAVRRVRRAAAARSTTARSGAPRASSPSPARPIASAGSRSAPGASRRSCSSASTSRSPRCCRRWCCCGPASSATPCRRARPRADFSLNAYRQLFANRRSGSA